jgi:AraC-like DNA-binding protein
MLFKVAGANTHFIVDDVPSPLTEDSAVLVDAWRPHEFLHRPGQPSTQILALYLDPEWLANFRRDWIRSSEFNFFNTTCGPVNAASRQLVMALAECLSAGAESLVDAELLLSELVISMIDRSSAYGRQAPRLSEYRLVDWRIRKAMGHIQGKAGDSTSIDHIIGEIGMSRSNFFRQFKACTGMSPGLFQNVVRLEQAVRLTIASQEPLGSAASRLGFVDQAHFSRFFRNHTAVSPRAYRQGAIEHGGVHA